jgi:hypothetical protein
MTFLRHPGCDVEHCVRHDELVRLTAFLCEEGYTAEARTAILRHVRETGTAAGLVESALVEPGDLDLVVEAIREGLATPTPAPVPVPIPEPKPVDLSAYAIAAEVVADDLDGLAIDLGQAIEADNWHLACSTMRRVADRLGMHARSLQVVVARARTATETDDPVEPAAAPPTATGPVLVPPDLDDDDDLTLPPISGGAPEPDADGFVPSEDDERWLARNSRPPIRSAGDLLSAIAQFLTSLGLEPEVRGDAADFLFLNHLHLLELEDLAALCERFPLGMRTRPTRQRGDRRALPW